MSDPQRAVYAFESVDAVEAAGRLAMAREVRQRHAGLRAEVRSMSGRDAILRAAALIERPIGCGQMRVRSLLRSVPGFGPATVAELMAAGGVPAVRRLGGLSPAGRARLAGLVRERLEAPRRRSGLWCERCGEGPLRVRGLCGWCVEQGDGGVTARQRGVLVRELGERT